MQSHRFVAPLALVACLPFAACGGDSGAAAVITTPPAGPKDAVTRMFTAIEKQELGNVWALLPEQHQKDVKGLLSTLSTKVDAEVYNKSMATMKNLVSTLQEKKGMILEIAKQEAGANLPPGTDLDGMMTSIINLADGLVGSDRLATTEKLGSLDVGAFLNETGKKVLPALIDIAKMQGGKDSEQALAFLTGTSKVKVEEKEVKGDHAVVAITMPDGKPEEVHLVKVGDHWLPEEMQADWGKMMAEAKSELEAMPKMDAQQKMQAEQILGMLDALIKDAKEAESAEELMETVQRSPVMGMLMGGMGGGPR